MSGPLVSASAAFVAKNSRIPPYAIEQSLRFDGGGSKLVLASPSSSYTTNKFTMSCWVKMGPIASDFRMMGRDGAPNNVENVWCNFNPFGNNVIASYMYTASINGRGVLNTLGTQRDPSAWYHIVFGFDSGTGNTQRIWVNGVEETTGTDTISGVAGFAWSSTYPFVLGGGTSHGYVAEYHFIDNNWLNSPNDFGAFDDEGVWKPIEYTGSYGTNGFYLKFDPTAANGIGHDHSGTGNHLTATGFATSGTGTDVMDDTPTTNWCTLNPLDKFNNSAVVAQNGNLEFNQSAAAWYAMRASFGMTSGKWYWEVKNISGLYQAPGLGNSDADLNGYASEPDTWLYVNTGQLNTDGTLNSAASWGGNSHTTNDIVGVAFDADNGKLWFSKNGTWQGDASPNPATDTDPAVTGLTGGPYFPYFVQYQTTTEVNFGQREFAYPPGTASATDYFNCVTYTGNGGNLSVTGVGFQPDFVWIKNRGRTSSPHVLVDVVRGATKALTTGTGGDTTMNGTDDFKSFDSDGFSLGTSSNFFVNSTNDTHVAWCWKAGGAASDNTDGDITSSVSVNQDAGFSVVSYTSQSTKPLNVGHGLGKKPDFILTKNRDVTASWGGYHSGTGATKSMFINSTGSGTVALDYFNNTEPTDSVFTVFDSNNTHAYGTSNEFIAYCWTEKAGVSKFGTYTGNGSSTGPFIECGFKPRLVIVKRTDAASNWFMYDTIRGTNNKLYAENTGTENSEDGGSTSSNTILSLSNGFQMTSGNGSNASGGTYIFMAWAENFSADATYKALNTSNLPAPTIKDGSDYFNTVTYTGSVTDTSTQAVTGVGFQSDLTWIKRRDGANSHQLVDAVRGTGNWLESNSTNSEASTNTNGVLTSFNSDGFTLTGGSTNANLCCESGFTYVAWNWIAGGSVLADNNTDGTITSTVSANPTAGFSIVQFNATGANGSIGHGLGVAPSFIVAKSKTHADNWFVYHSTIGPNGYIMLNQTSAVDSPNSTVWQNVSPTSTVFYASTGGYNDSGETIIAYCFAEVEGYSKFGSYSGGDGVFVYLGFKPSLLILKGTVGTRNWIILDSKRSTYNVVDDVIHPNLSNAESVQGSSSVDFVSNGFVTRGGNISGSGDLTVFAAFAENPFGGSGVNPATAR